MINSRTIMTSAILTPNSSVSSNRKLTVCAFSNSAIIIPKHVSYHHLKCIPQLGLTPFSSWNGLRHLGLSTSRHPVKIERKGKCKGKGVYASLFGVGAPEALVIGVVALLVFGPKGLAEVARNLGKTLRSFQPTIRELQEVSREFKSTLQREIGLDESESPAERRSPPNANSDSNVSPPEPEDPLAAQLRSTLAQLQKEQAEEAEAKAKAQAEGQVSEAAQEVTSEISPSENPENNAVEEAASTVDSSPQPQSNAAHEVASAIAPPAKPEGNEHQEAVSAVSPPSKSEN